jgi:hypothetical protein
VTGSIVVIGAGSIEGVGVGSSMGTWDGSCTGTGGIGVDVVFGSSRCFCIFSRFSDLFPEVGSPRCFNTNRKPRPDMSLFFNSLQILSY